MELMRIEQADRQTDLLSNDPNWLRQIGVVAHEDRHLEPLTVGVSQQVGSEIHVRPFSSVLSTQTLCAGSTLVSVVNWPYFGKPGQTEMEGKPGQENQDGKPGQTESVSERRLEIRVRNREIHVGGVPGWGPKDT